MNDATNELPVEQATEESHSGLELMREPFPPHQIGKLPKSTKKDNPKGNCKECGGYHGLPAVHLDYVGHAALTDRLLDADPEWSWEPLAFDEGGLPRFDKDGGLWIRLTVCGVTRLGYGNADDKPYMDTGARVKEVVGDCLRNAAMRFGAALNLWHKGDLHIETPADEDEPEPLSDDQIAGYKKSMEACTSRDALKNLMSGENGILDAVSRDAKAYDEFKTLYRVLRDKLPAGKK